MNDFTPLTRPLQPQVTIDSTAKECPSEGFNYPNFRQLNKQARVYLSLPLNPNPSTAYHLFAVANSKGWFAAVQSTPSGPAIAFSTLEDLRSAFSSAKEDSQDLFSPKRILPLGFGNANIIFFACGDTRLLVGLESGTIAVYDTASLFAPGTNEVPALNTTQIQSSALRQILPNPGTEPSLIELFAVVGDGKVALLNMQLEPQGGWAASDLMTQPISVAWSPKGKHIAIGLQTGDILTYSLTNKSTPHKHIPPTAAAILVSLNWPGPGHTFRTSYAAQGDAPAKQHVIVLDAKSSTATYFAPDHPYPSADRTVQSAYTLSFPKWDEDSVSTDENKCLTVVGDLSSVDLEVLGNVGNQWYRQSQDNPLSLPLDKSMDDTMLLALEADLTDATAGSPIMYAYVNDGSLQGWHAEHSKPYMGMMTPNGSTSNILASQSRESKDSDMGAESTTPAQPTQTTSAFSPTPSNFGGQQTGTFGQSGFGQPQGTSPFGQPSFGQPAFGQSPFGGFGQSNQPTDNTNSTFGSAKPATGFGAFGNTSSGAFGSTGSSAFGGSSSPSAFSGFSSNTTTNAFGGASFGTPVATSTNSLSPPQPPDMTREASMSDSTPPMGSMGLGSATPTNPNATNSMFGTFGAPVPTNQGGTSTAFDSGVAVKPASGFGAFGGAQTSGAFDTSNKPTPPLSAFSIAQPAATTSSAFGQSGFGQPAFGQSGFGSSAFGKPSLPAPAFGKPSLGTSSPGLTAGGFSAFATEPTSFTGAATPQKPSVFGSPESKPATSGGFSSFASATPSAFGQAATMANSSESKASAGFGSFSSNAPSAFSKPSSESIPQSSSSLGSAFSPFASTSPSPFGSTAASSTTTADANKTPTERTSVFGTAASSTTSTSAFGTPLRSPFGGSTAPSPEPPKPAFALSPPSSPEPSSVVGTAGSPSTPAASPTPSAGAFGTLVSTPSPTRNSGGAFGNIVSTPSVFKPATGFGAFGSAESPKASPFFKKADENPQPVSVFGNLSPSTSKTVASGATTPTFGTPTALGGPKSAFAPISPASPTPAKTIATPSSGGFGSFSGSSNGFSAFAGPKKSFSELLKTDGEMNKDPVKRSASTSATPSATPLKGKEKEKDEPQSSSSRTSVFGTAKTETKAAEASVFGPISKETDSTKIEERGEQEKPEGEEKKKGALTDEPSYGTISASSAGSSFVEIDPDADRSNDDADGQSDEDAEHQDDHSDFLTDDDYEAGEVESDEEEDEEEDEEDSLPEDGEDEQEGPSSPLEPTAVPLPSSRSPSATPQPEVPKVEVSPSPPSGEASTSPKPSFEREASTTPPGTPAKEIKPFFAQPSTASSSSSSTPPPPFGIGLGRPSTRPTRSSPLANAVTPGDDEEDSNHTRDGPPAVSPRPVFGVLPPEKKIKKEPSPSDEGQPPSAKRPKTPPLLSTISSPAPSSAPAPQFSFQSKSPSPTPGISSSKTDAPAASPFSFSPKPAESQPSTSGFFGKTPEASGTPTTKPATLVSPFNLFGAKSSGPSAAPPANAFGMPAFSLNTPISPPALSTGPISSFGAQQSAARPPSFGGGAPSTPAKSSGPPTFFGAPTKQPPGAPGSSLFGAPSAPPPTPASPFSPPKPPPTVVPAPPPRLPEETLEEGMQKSCVILVNTVNKDLHELARAAAQSRHMLTALNVPAGGSKLKADLGDPSKWGMTDLQQFKQVLLQYQSDLAALEALREKEKQALREIQSNMLKAGTRREEVARFNKAKDDKEFAKMLKARTLGPEHSETQTQLRKSIRAIRDRVQKLEKHLQDDKKRLTQSQSCKPSIKAPSLDTINRTYRNIDIAIEQQTDDINRLATRVSKINLAAVPNSPSLRDARLPDPAGPRRPYNVTANVAVTTAAALNAERSAQRLKKALLSVRKEPLFNSMAANVPKAPSELAKLNSGSGFAGLKTGSLFADPPMDAPEMVIQGLPEDKFDPTMSISTGGGISRASKQRKHTPAPHLKRSAEFDTPGATPAAAPVAFDWGPLPKFSPSSSKAFIPLSAPPTAPPTTVPKGFVSFGKSPSPSPSVVQTPAAAPPANLPKGFVSFSSSPSPSASSPAAGPAPSVNTPPGFFSFAPSSPQPPAQGFFSFSNQAK